MRWRNKPYVTHVCQVSTNLLVDFWTAQKSANNLSSGFEFDKKKDDIPSITPLDGVKLTGRYSTPLLLLCWQEYVEQMVRIFNPEINVLIHLASPKEELNNGNNNANFGYSLSTGVFRDTVKDRLHDAKSFVPETWLFSTFLKGVKSGAIDCDKLPIVKNNLQKPYN